jgi:hypothetical protein
MSTLKETDIKGKPYVEVNERLKYFRANFTGYSLLTEIITLDDEKIVIRANIKNDKGIIVAQGLAREKNGDSFINKTSYVENCETSAWGRALANFGIGIDGSVSSADEVQNAIENQKKKTIEDKIDESTEQLDNALKDNKQKVQSQLGQQVTGTFKSFIDDIEIKLSQGVEMNPDHKASYDRITTALTANKITKAREQEALNKLKEILEGLK